MQIYVIEMKHLSSEIVFYLSLLRNEDKLYLCIKNERVHFILLLVCIIFVQRYLQVRIFNN